MKNVYQWGYSQTATINNPNIETLKHFLDRKTDSTGFQNTEDWALHFLTQYKNIKTGFDFFIGTPEEFEKFKHDFPIMNQGKNGQFSINITYIQGIMDFLFKLAAHEGLFANNPNVNDRMVDNLDADYLIEASQLNRGAIDEFKFETNTMLTILFTRLEQNNSEHLTGKIDKLYLELIELLKEFESIDHEADLPKQLIAILEKIHKAFTPQTVNNGHTLSSEMPVNAGGTQTK